MRVAVLGHGGAGVGTVASGLRELGLAAFDSGTALERAVALRAATVAVFVVSSPDGLHPATAALWDALPDLPRVVAVTRLDDPRADFDESVAVCQRVLGDGVVVLSVPVHDDGGSVAGVLELLGPTLADSSGGRRVERAPDPEHVALVEGLRTDLVEATLAGAEDPDLLDGYLGGVEPGPDTLARELAAAVGRVELHPVLAVAPLAGGVGPLAGGVGPLAGGVGLVELGRLLQAVPAPPYAPAVTRPDGAPAAPLHGAEGGPLAAEVLGLQVAADGSRTARVLVHSGVLRPGAQLHVSAHDRPPSSDQAGQVSGDGVLVEVTGLLCVQVGDTLSSPQDPLLLQAWDLPEPTLPVFLARGQGLEAGLARLAVEDPTVRFGDDLVWVQDEAHAAGVVARLGAQRLPAEPPPVAVAIEVRTPTWAVRTVRQELTRRGAAAVTTRQEVEQDELEHDVERDREQTVLRATVTGTDLLTWAEDLARLTHGTGRTRLTDGLPALRRLGPG